MRYFGLSTAVCLLMLLTGSLRGDMVDDRLEDLVGTDVARRRIAAEVLQHLPDPRVTKAMASLPLDPLNPLDARVACVNIIRFQKLTDALETLAQLATDKAQPVALRAPSVVGIAELSGAKHVDLFIEMVRTEELSLMRAAAARALGSTGDPATIERIGALLDDPKAAPHAAAALGETENPIAVPLLTAKLGTENLALRNTIIEILGELKDPRAVAPLIALLEEKNELQSVYVLKALGNFDDPTVISKLVEVLSTRQASMNLRMNALLALEKIHNPAVLTNISAVASSQGEDMSLRMSATRALGSFGIDAMPALIILLDDKGLSNTAALALTKITGSFFGKDRDRWVQYYKEHSQKPPGRR